MREEAALAHPDGLGQPADREPVEALDGRELRGLVEDRAAAPLAVAAPPPRGTLGLGVRVASRSSLDKLARSFVYSRTSARTIVLSTRERYPMTICTNPRSDSRQGPPAGDLGERRLRRDRNPDRPRRRAPLRRGRPARRLDRARRRHRERQRRHRRRPPRLRRDRHRLRPRAPRARPRARRGRATRPSSSSTATPRSCRSPTGRSTPPCRSSARCSRPTTARAAAELARVVRPGGTIALASWTPDGFVGAMFRTVAAHVPPPAGLASPMLWGTEEHLARDLRRRT